MGDALVKHDSDAAALAPGEWKRERVELVKKTVCPTGITDAELGLFVEVCKRSGLDPLTKEIFCVPRRTNVGSKDSPRWITKHEAQPAEAGLLARADRFSDFGGIKAAAYYEGDDITITEDTVHHKFNPAKRQGKLLGAWAQPFRAGKVYPVELVTLDAYRQNTPQWQQKPETMIVKCARAAALRRAYPNAFSGLYLKEEMPAEEFENVVEARRVERLPATTAEAGSPCAQNGHEWDLTGKCQVCGAVESGTKVEPKKEPAQSAKAAKAPPVKQPPHLRARAIKVWQEAQKAGQDLTKFQAWTEKVLQRKSESASWTEDEIAHLEDALLELKAFNEPGGEG